MSAVVLGRLLTRPDMGGALGEFLDWVPAALARVEPLRAPFLLPGEGGEAREGSVSLSLQGQAWGRRGVGRAWDWAGG